MTSKDDIMSVDVGESNEHLTELAQQKAGTMGSLNESITNGDGNYAGILAEYVFVALFENAERVDKYHYDVQFTTDSLQCRTFDIKTAQRTVPAKPHYSCFVSTRGLDQNCDGYYFCSYDKSNQSMELLGYLPKHIFREKATFREKGDTKSNGFEIKSDCHEVLVRDLHQLNVDIDN